MHEPARDAHAFVARRRVTAGAARHEPLARVCAFFAIGGVAAIAGKHVSAGCEGAAVTFRLVAAITDQHERAARVCAVFALGGMATNAGEHVSAGSEGALVTFPLVAAIADHQERAILVHAVFANSSAARPVTERHVCSLVAVVAPELLARVASQHVLRILRADLHAAVACASLANQELLANVALGDVELAAADKRL